MESPSESELPSASSPGPGGCDPGEPSASCPSDAADASAEASPFPTPLLSSLSSGKESAFQCIF